MPTTGNITLTDNLPDPDVSRIFYPYERVNGRTTWRAAFVDPVIGNPRINVTQWVKNPGTTKAKEMATVSVTVPVLETLGTSDSGFTPAPTVKWINAMRLEMEVHESTSVALRSQLYVLFQSLLSDASITSALVNGDRFRG